MTMNDVNSTMNDVDSTMNNVASTSIRRRLSIYTQRCFFVDSTLSVNLNEYWFSKFDKNIIIFFVSYFFWRRKDFNNTSEIILNIGDLPKLNPSKIYPRV